MDLPSTSFLAFLSLNQVYSSVLPRLKKKKKNSLLELVIVSQEQLTLLPE